MSDIVPNCSNCGYKDNDWCEKLKRIMNWSEVSMVSEVGCIHNPKTREYFTQDIIKELERLEDNLLTSAFVRGAYRKAIFLIKNGVDKK